MIKYTQGNLLQADVEALVNTVNTVGVMGKGIALMFKERFPYNMMIYSDACKRGEVRTGKMLVTETGELSGPKWIINFPTKQHWKAKSQIEWIVEGLQDLREFIIHNQVKSIAIPPLGAGNGGLLWDEVKPKIEHALNNLKDVDIYVYEPTAKYQNVAKLKGVEELTPARALIAELIRRYWVMGIDCSMLEIQKLAWFLERSIALLGLPDPLKLTFKANNYGPYADNLRHLLNHLDGSYIKSDKRISDTKPLDVIWFNDEKQDLIKAYIQSEAKQYIPALNQTSSTIDGFESPYGMELLSTVDWILSQKHVEKTPNAVLQEIKKWPAGEKWALRKESLFNQSRIDLALKRLEDNNFCVKGIID